MGRLTLLTLLSCWPGAVRPGGGTRSALLDGSYPALRDSDKRLTEVAWAKGVPAVVLLSTVEDESMKTGTEWRLRMQRARRVKLLTSAGVERNADYSLDLYGDWRVESVKARTLLPDGTEVDASSNIYREKTKSGLQVVRVAFPRAQVGAILDFYITLVSDSWYVAPFELQESIPVLESRLVVIPPSWLDYRCVGLHMPQELAKPEVVHLQHRSAYVWAFDNVEALPDEPNMPPSLDVSRTLVVIPVVYKDWKTASTWGHDWWTAWWKGAHAHADTLAATVIANKTDPVEKAEAIRTALRDRLHADYTYHTPSHASVDEALDKGSGTSGDVAGVAVAMLRSVGIDADIVYYRHRESGEVPPTFPIPSLFEDDLVRIGTTKGPVYFRPASDLPVGKLPADSRGVLGIALDGTSEAPVSIPDYNSVERRSTRSVEAILDAEGKISGESVETLQGLAAEEWRGQLRGTADAKRSDLVRDRLRLFVPGAELQSLETENLEDSGKDLVLRSRWSAEGYATPAGKRILVNPHLYDRILASDWAATERATEIELGGAYETVDTIAITLPAGARDVSMPVPSDLSAGPVGQYTTTVQRQGQKVVVTRRMRLESHRFPVQAYLPLKKWLGRIAAADGTPIVIELP